MPKVKLSVLVRGTICVFDRIYPSPSLSQPYQLSAHPMIILILYISILLLAKYGARLLYKTLSHIARSRILLP